MAPTDGVCPQDGAPARAVQVAHVPASLASRFRTVTPFAVGDTGSSFVVTQRGDERRLLLKLIHPSAAGSAAERTRLQRELQRQTTLHLPFTAQVVETGIADGVAWLLREYVSGESLATRIKQRAGLPLSEALAVVGQAATALDDLHRAGLLHRDVKPGHVMLTGSSSVPEVRLIDPGVVGKLPSNSVLEVMGSAGYVAPEVSAGRPASFRSDIYGLGCVLYEALSGSLPITTSAEDELPPIPERELPPQIWTLLVSILAHDPRRRPFSAQHVRRALEPFLPPGMPAPRAVYEPLAKRTAAAAAAATKPSLPPAPPLSSPPIAPSTRPMSPTAAGRPARLPEPTTELSLLDMESASIPLLPVIAAQAPAAPRPRVPEPTEELSLLELEAEETSVATSPGVGALSPFSKTLAPPAFSAAPPPHTPPPATPVLRPRSATMISAAPPSARRPATLPPAGPMFGNLQKHEDTAPFAIPTQQGANGGGKANTPKPAAATKTGPQAAVASEAAAAAKPASAIKTGPQAAVASEVSAAAKPASAIKTGPQAAVSASDFVSAPKPKAALETGPNVAGARAPLGVPNAGAASDELARSVPSASAFIPAPDSSATPSAGVSDDNDVDESAGARRASPLHAADPAGAPPPTDDAAPAREAGRFDIESLFDDKLEPERRPQMTSEGNTMPLESAIATDPPTDSGRPSIGTSTRRATRAWPMLAGAAVLGLVAISLSARACSKSDPDRFVAKPAAVPVAPAPAPVPNDVAVKAANPTPAAPDVPSVPARHVPSGAARQVPSGAARNAPSSVVAEPIAKAAAVPSEPVAAEREESSAEAAAARTLTAAQAKPRSLAYRQGKLDDVDHKAKAREFYTAGKYREAAEAYERASQKTPSDPGAFAGLGASYLAAKQPDRAISAYQRAVQLSPQVSGFQAALGRAYLLKGDRGRAAAAYRKALELDPKNSAAKAGLDSLAH